MVSSADPQAILDRLREENRHSALVLFVGAGASRDAGLPDWAQLLQPLQDELGIVGQADALDIAQWYSDRFGRPQLLRHVRQLLAAQPVEPGGLHCLLAQLAAPVVFTTNYDQLLERALEEAQGVPPDVIIEDAHIPLIDEARRTTVVKLHGCLSLPNTIVLARDDYEDYGTGHRAMIAYLQALLATRTVLFVGFSLIDPNFRVIHHAIRQAVGAHRLRAYALDAGRAWSYRDDYWQQKGITTLLFATFADQRPFLGAIAEPTDSRGRTPGLAVLGAANPPPPLDVGPFVARLHEVERALRELVEAARQENMLPDADTIPVDQLPAELAGASSVREKARALLDLATAVDRLTRLDDPRLWVTLGNLLYEEGDVPSAIQAYQTVLRPTAERRRLDEAVLLRVRGNLARALALQGHDSRAEWLLRRCVFRPGREDEEGVGRPTRRGVYERLNLSHLEERPMDAAEFAYLVARRVERLRQAGHPEQAFAALYEPRSVLEPLLGIVNGHEPAPAQDLFGDRPASEGRGRWRHTRAQERGRANHSFYPKAWALTFLGKCYRLSCSLALELGRNDVDHYLRRGIRYLKQAITLDPLLPYPYGHWLELQRDDRMPPANRERIRREVRLAVDALKEHGPAGVEVAASLRSRFPEAFAHRLPSQRQVAQERSTEVKPGSLT